MRRRYKYAVAVCAVVLVACLTFWSLGNGEVPSTQEAKEASIISPEVIATSDKPSSDSDSPSGSGVGSVQSVPWDLNDHTRSIEDVARTGEHPERVSVYIQPKPFDPEAYAKDPDAYLSIVEPGRAYQSAQPGPGVPVIRPIGRRFHTLLQGESTDLKVRVPAGAPVTFTSFDLGAFENKLTTITVKANEEGIAKATFTGTPGTINNVHILAGCPLATGQVEYVVYIQLPETAKGGSGSSGF